MRRKRGFSLLEIIIAMVLAILILFSIGVLIPLAQLRYANTSHRDIGVTLAENMMEGIRLMKWDDIPKRTDPARIFDGLNNDAQIKNTPSSKFFPPDPYPMSTYGMISGGLSHEVRYIYVISSIYEPATEELAKIVVSVYWKETSGEGILKDNNITLSSKIFKR